MELVDDQDDIARTAGIVDHAFHPAFKLTPELSSGNHGRHTSKKSS